MKQGSDEWHAARDALDVTGSIAGAIRGTSPYQTREDVIREKVRARHGAEREFAGNIATEWGTEHEPDAIRAFEGDTGLIVTPAALAIHVDLGWLGYSADGVTASGLALVEAKCPYSGGIPDEVPNHYMDQVQTGMEVLRIPVCHFIYWTPTDYREFFIERDLSYFDDLLLPDFQEYREQLAEAMAHPEPYLEPLVKDMDSSTEWCRLAAKYRQALADMDKAKSEAEILKAELIEMTGGVTAQGGGLKLTKVTSKGRIDYRRVPEIQGVDLEQYRGKDSESYRITVDK